MRTRVLIMGAAGRDFHNFNVCFRHSRRHAVQAFTASQIPNIAGRTYPPELAGPLYPHGIPIFDESELSSLIERNTIDEVVFSYSDISHVEVMHRASIANALGADFRLLGTRATMLPARRPVISVCAVRTGCGKSSTSVVIATLLQQNGAKVVVVRHPMPYGRDLAAQRCQRFETLSDLDRYECTIEEREEYEPHIAAGHVVYAGVDYSQILNRAEREADVLLWDGGNNDVPFFQTDLHIVLADAHRPGHELLYHPGETNLRMAQVIVLAKSGDAAPSAIERILDNAAAVNPAAAVICSDSVVEVADPAAIRGKRVLVVEDGPTLTHGGMSSGAGHAAARRFGAAAIVDPRPYAAGTIRSVFERHPHLTEVLPAMGYGEAQIRDLAATIEMTPCDVVLVGTPIDLGRLIRTSHPTVRVWYRPDTDTVTELGRIVQEFLESKRIGRHHAAS
jgi:predicted GTPase